MHISKVWGEGGEEYYLQSPLFDALEHQLLSDSFLSLSPTKRRIQYKIPWDKGTDIWRDFALYLIVCGIVIDLTRFFYC
jgi:hypothetical protein